MSTVLNEYAQPIGYAMYKTGNLPGQGFLRQLNQATRSGDEQRFLANICSQKPSQSELYRYCQGISRIIVFHINVSQRIERTEISLSADEYFEPCKRHGSVSIYKSSYLKITKDNHLHLMLQSTHINVPASNGNINYSKSVIRTQDTITYDFLDVKTYYNILRRRESCFELNPSFARVRTRFEFESKVISLSKQPLHILDQYLKLNASMFNIPVPDDFNKMFSRNREGNIIKDVLYSSTGDYNIPASIKTKEDYYREEGIVMAEYNNYMKERAPIRQDLITKIYDKIDSLDDDK